MGVSFNDTNINSPRGVNFPDGVRAGNFLLPGGSTCARGVSVVEPIVWTVCPAQGVIFYDQTFETPGTYYMNISSPIVQDAYPQSTFINNMLKLDCERLIKARSEGQFSMKISMTDIYNRKVVVEGDATDSPDPWTFKPLRGGIAINSVKVTTTEADQNIRLFLEDVLVLPFAINAIALQNARYSYFDTIEQIQRLATLFRCETTDNVPYFAVRNFQYVPSIFIPEEFTPLSGSSRPLLDLFSGSLFLDRFDGFNNYLTICFDQITMGNNNQEPEFPYNNNLEGIIGIQPYAVGWEAFNNGL